MSRIVSMMLVIASLTVSSAAIADDVRIVAQTKDTKKMSEAQAKFATHCAVCHGAGGQGLIGPNLTDAFWIKGARPSDIASSIGNGSPSKGMPPMAILLGPDGVQMMAAYVTTLQGRNLPGKGPEGVEVK